MSECNRLSLVNSPSIRDLSYFAFGHIVVYTWAAQWRHPCSLTCKWSCLARCSHSFFKHVLISSVKRAVTWISHISQRELVLMSPLRLWQWLELLLSEGNVLNRVSWLLFQPFCEHKSGMWVEIRAFPNSTPFQTAYDTSDTLEMTNLKHARNKTRTSYGLERHLVRTTPSWRRKHMPQFDVSNIFLLKSVQIVDSYEYFFSCYRTQKPHAIGHSCHVKQRQSRDQLI